MNKPITHSFTLRVKRKRMLYERERGLDTSGEGLIECLNSSLKRTF